MKRGIVLAALLLLCLPVAVYATVNEVTPAKNDYLGSGSTTVFPYTFKILDKANIQVLVNGLVQLVDTNYSVSGVGDSGGGSITLFSAPALNVKVTLLRKQPVQQSSTYTSNEAFPATRLMSDLDKNIMVDQMQMEALDRAIKFRPESIYRSVAINDPVANQCLVWNSTATMINSQACGTGGGGGSGAPLTATYILKTPNSLLPNAQALSVLNSGAMMSTTVTGAVSIYTGSTCVGTFFRGLNASLSATCEAVSLTADTTGILLPAKGGTGAGAFTAGSIPFIGASGVYTQNNGQFFWDNVNNRLGIGTTAPTHTLHLVSNTNAATFETVDSVTNSVSAANRLKHTSTGTMADGFGVAVNFVLRDVAAVDNIIGQIAVRRSTDNTTAEMALRTAILGTFADRLVVDAVGAVTIGNLASAGTSCVQVNTAGKLALSGAACGSVVMVDAAHGGTNTDSSAATGFAKVTAGTWTFTMTPTFTTMTSGSVTTTAQGAVVIGPYGASAGNVGELRFLELAANGTNYVALVSPDSITTTRKIILPATPGSASTCLSTDGGSPIETWGYSSCAGAGTGLTSLNGLTGSTQTFTNDTNVTITSSGTAHVLGWAGALSSARGGFGLSTAGSTGVPSVNAGTWSVAAQLQKTLGGTGGVGGTATHVAYWAATSLTGDAAFTWDSVNQKLTVGSTTSASPALVSTAAPGTAGSSATVRFEAFTGGGLNSPRTALSLARTTTGAMTDGFGPRLDFVLRDSDNVDNVNTRFVVSRAGADGTSTLDIQTAIAGTLANRISIANNGTVSMPGTSGTSFSWSPSTNQFLLPETRGTVVIGRPDAAGGDGHRLMIMDGSGLIRDGAGNYPLFIISNDNSTGSGVQSGGMQSTVYNQNTAGSSEVAGIIGWAFSMAGISGFTEALDGEMFISATSNGAAVGQVLSMHNSRPPTGSIVGAFSANLWLHAFTQASASYGSGTVITYGGQKVDHALLIDSNQGPGSGNGFANFFTAADSAGTITFQMQDTASTIIGGGAVHQGPGTINVTGNLFRNGTAYINPDFVFEHAFTGKIERFADREGASTYTGLRSLEDMESFVKVNYQFPALAAIPHRGLFDGGDAVLVTLEEGFLHLFDHERRLKALEARCQ